VIVVKGAALLLEVAAKQSGRLAGGGQTSPTRGNLLSNALCSAFWFLLLFTLAYTIDI